MSFRTTPLNASRGFAAALLLLLIGFGGTTSATEVVKQELSMVDFLQARWPSRPALSPDSRYISFLWTNWRTQDLYVVPVDGQSPPLALTQSEQFLGGATWNSAGAFGTWLPDSSGLVYADDGDLFLASVHKRTAQRLTETPAIESSPLVAPDGKRLAFTRDEALFLLDLATGHETRVGDVGRMDLVRFSPDGEWIAGTVSESPIELAYSPAFSGPLLVFRRFRGAQRDVAIVSVRTGEVRTLLASPEREAAITWSPDSAGLLIERTDTEVERRWLYHVNLHGDVLATLHTRHDERYINSNDWVAAFSPDGKQVLYTSDEDGFNHLYLIPSSGGTARQLTEGPFEVSFPSWAPDGQHIRFASTEEGTEQRQIYAISVSGGERTRLTDLPGLNTTVVYSTDGERMAFIHADAKRIPDLWVKTTSPSSQSRQLTDSMNDVLKSYPWQAPEIVTFPGHEGLPIKAQLFRPRNFDPSRRYPAIVHVHQAAIYQEVFAGSGPHKDNVAWYGWHQRLADRGYVVLNVDFRGSYGYGRDFRTLNYLDIGVGDAADVVKGVEYLDRLGFVDLKRVGVYGMSYGGHMVLTLLSKYPEMFAAGVNIAGVLDFQLEGGPWDVRNAWMYARLGTPEDNPDAYFNASSRNFLDNLIAPILTVQGTADVHVNFLQSITLVNELLVRGKRFEFEVYPGEPHFFSQHRSWVDAFGKMERFLDQYVRDRI